MEKQYHFRPKRFGYGVYPISKIGWLLTALLILVVFLSAFSHDIIGGIPNQKQVAHFLVELLVIALLFLQLVKPMTEGEIRWNWGKRK